MARAAETRTMRNRWVRMILAVWACALAPAAIAAPSFIVIYMDDQRINTTWAMPNVQALAKQGVTFQRAYITTPLCTPSRNSFLSGGFSPRNIGVLDNSRENGWGNTLNSDVQQLGIALQRAGYRTAMIGKGAGYNGGWVAPGWDTLREMNTGSYYTDVTVASGSSGPDSPGQATIIRGIPYVPHYLRDEAVTFLENVPDGQPFFLFYAPPSMHEPAIPDPSGIDAKRFSTYSYRGRGHGEADLSDKPGWVSDPNRRKAVKVPETDQFHRNQLRTLRDTDRAIGQILAKLAQKGRDDDTVVVFASDNGYLWGEHGLYQKGNAYEESVRVPMIIRAPGAPRRTEQRLVAVNLDVPATVLAQAGASLDGGRSGQGRDLTALIYNTPTTWRAELFLEGHGTGDDGSYGAWGALLSGNWKYIVHRSGDEELYNRYTDPYELESRASDPSVAATKNRLAARVASLKGLTIRKTSGSQPVGRVGQTYHFSPQAWGGKPPYQFSIISGSLPSGLILNSSNGDISGIPELAGKSTFTLQVTDTSRSPFNGKSQRWIETYTLTVR